MLRAMATAPRDGTLIHLVFVDLSGTELGFWGERMDGPFAWIQVDSIDSWDDDTPFAGWLPFDEEVARLMKARWNYAYA